MNLLQFFSDKGQYSRPAIIALVVSSGVAGGILIAVVNAAAEQTANSEVSLHYLFLFILTLAFFAITKRIALISATRAGERAIRETRIRLSNKIRHSELLFVEHTGHGDLYARLTQDTASISQAVPMVFNGCQSAVLLAAGLVYVATVSLPAFALTASFLGAGAYIYTQHSRIIVANLRKATAKEAEFFESLRHLVDGFKEIKINRAKNEEVHERVAEIARETEGLMVNTGERYVSHLVGSQTMVYLLIAAIVFALPTLDFTNPERVLKLTAAGLFIVAPLEVLFTAYYFYNKAAVALRNIANLEQRLDAALEDQEIPTHGEIRPWGDFNEIVLKGIRFHYPGAGATYGIGPIDLTIGRGTTTFITGGNGSGKSTLLKVLTGLYPATAGRILVDDRPVDAESLPAYREMFSAIFSDFHLFDRLYGLHDVNVREVEHLLGQMEIADKTGFVDNAFTTLDLSTGQRKRLAMVIARLESRPIYIFDEWAADQDPQFRAYFYESLLPQMKAEGKTLIVVTHDDAYFHCADKLIKLDYGQVALSG